MKISFDFKRDSKNGTQETSGIKRIGSLVRNISQKTGLVRTSDTTNGSGSRLPVIWTLARSRIIKVGAVVFAVAIVGVVVSYLVRHFISSRVD